MFFNGKEKAEIKKLKNLIAFINHSETIDDINENLEGYNPTRKRTVLIVFDDMIADIGYNKKLRPVFTRLFLRGRKLNISLVSMSQSSFKVPKTVRVNTKHYFIMKISKKRELQEKASNHLSDIDFKYFMKIYKEYAKESYSFLVNDTTLSSDNPLILRNNYHKIEY